MIKVRKRVIVSSVVAGLIISFGLAWYTHQQGAEKRQEAYLHRMTEQMNREDPSITVTYDSDNGLVRVYPKERF